MINMINEQYKYSERTGLIIGCAMEVHKQMGNGFQEVIYQRALAIEFETLKNNSILLYTRKKLTTDLIRYQLFSFF